MIRSRRLFRAAASTVLASACTVAENTGLTADLPLWTVAAEPTMTLGDDGTPARLFSGITVARLPDGGLLIADRGSKELRIFRDGALVTSLSRQGDGPGELRDLSRVSVSGDTIVVIPLPMVSREVSTFTAAGGFVSRRRLRPASGGPTITPIALLASGAFLVEEGRGMRAFNEVPPLGVPMPDSVSLGLLRQPAADSTGEYWPVGRFLRTTTVAHRVEGTPIPFSMARLSLAPHDLWVASGNLVWVAGVGSGALQAFDGAGETVVRATLPLQAGLLSPDVVQRSRALALTRARTAIDTAAAEAAHDSGLLPSSLPVVDALVAGHDGELWVRRFELEPGPTREYLVVNRAGQTVARLLVPADLSIHQVGADFILGVRQDADGVETVVEYRLMRTGV